MISKSDLKFIQCAMSMAENSPCYNQHGCVLVQNGKIVSQGYNHYDISKHSLSSNTTHAEIDALTKYFKRESFKPKVREKRKQKEKEC